MFNKNILLFLIYLLPGLCLAQGQHELKSDLIALLNEKAFGLSYEYGCTSKIGLELDVQRDFYKIFSSSRNSNFYNQHPDSTLIHEFYFLDFTIGANYYFAPKHGIDRYFLGFFWYNRFNTRKDKDWDSYNMEYNGRVSEFPRKWGRSRLGVKGGYKWPIRNHFVIELEPLIFYELDPGDWNGHVDWTLLVNIGYRF